MSVKVIINEPSIGLTDRTNYLAVNGQQNWWALQRGNRGTASLTFNVVSSDSYAPTVGTPIYLYSVNDSTSVQTLVFGGSIDKISLGYLGLTGQRIYSLSLVTFEQVLDTIYVNPPRSYSSTTAGAIVQDLLQTVCAGVPITAGSISNGPSIPSLVINNQRVSDVLTNLATQANFIWGVDQTTQSLYFFAATTTPAPFTLSSTSLLQDGTGREILWTQGRQNYRNRQLVQISQQAFAPSNCLIAGNGSTTVFNMPYAADSIIQILDTTGTQATTTGTFSGVPSVNDTITVAGQVYTFKSSIDNVNGSDTANGQVLIGASAAATAQNFVDAVNANPLTAGTAFCFAQHENALMNCDAPSGATFTIRSKLKGAAQNSLVLSKSCANFSWAAGSPSGGTDGTDVTKTVVVAGSGQKGDITFTQGATTGHVASKAVAFLTQSGQVGTPATAYLDFTGLGTGAPNSGDFVTVGSQVYRFITTPVQNYDIKIQTNPSNFQNIRSLCDAINGFSNPNVFTGTPANTSCIAQLVNAFAGAEQLKVEGIQMGTSAVAVACSFTAGGAPSSWTVSIGGANTSTLAGGSGAGGAKSAAYLTLNGGGATAGDTVTVAGVTYHFVSSVNNSIANQIKASGSSSSDGPALANAINGKTDGTFVSNATTANPSAEAFVNCTNSAQLYILSLRTGADQNFSVAVSITGGPSSWTASFGGSNISSMAGGKGAGGTFTLGSSTYTIQVGALNNAVFGQIYVGDFPSAATTATRIINAINGVTDGVTVSTATTANASANANTTGITGEIEVQALTAGTAGNSVASTVSNLSPANWVTTSGGVTTTTTLAGGLDNTLATVSTLTCTTAPAAGHSLDVSYYRLGADFIAVENTTLVASRASAEHGTGKYHALINDSSNLSAAAGLLEAQQALAAYSVLIQSFKFMTDSQLLSVGQYLAISCTTPTGLGTLINGNWIVQEVRGELKGPGATTSPYRLNWRYTVTVLNAQTLNYVQFWINLIP